jgi:hypothetical protein
MNIVRPELASILPLSHKKGLCFFVSSLYGVAQCSSALETDSSRHCYCLSDIKMALSALLIGDRNVGVALAKVIFEFFFEKFWTGNLTTGRESQSIAQMWLKYPFFDVEPGGSGDNLLRARVSPLQLRRRRFVRKQLWLSRGLQVVARAVHPADHQLPEMPVLRELS